MTVIYFKGGISFYIHLLLFTRTRGNGFKLKEVRFKLYTRKNFFTMRVVKH